MTDASTRFEAIDVLPCIGNQCNVDLEEEVIFTLQTHNYKVVTNRVRFITGFKRKATLSPNTSVSEVSAPRFARDVRRKKVGTSDKVQPGDKILTVWPYISYQETREVSWEKETPSADPLEPTQVVTREQATSAPQLSPTTMETSSVSDEVEFLYQKETLPADLQESRPTITLEEAESIPPPFTSETGTPDQEKEAKFTCEEAPQTQIVALREKVTENERIEQRFVKNSPSIVSDI